MTMDTVEYIIDQYWKYMNGIRDRFDIEELSCETGEDYENVSIIVDSMEHRGEVSNYVIFNELGVTPEDLVEYQRLRIPSNEAYNNSVNFLLFENEYIGDDLAEIDSLCDGVSKAAAYNIVFRWFEDIWKYINEKCPDLGDDKKYVLLMNVIERMVLDVLSTGLCSGLTMKDMIERNFAICAVAKDCEIEPEANAFEDTVDNYRLDIPSCEQFRDLCSCLKVSLKLLDEEDSDDIPDYLRIVAERCALKYYEHIYSIIKFNKDKLTNFEMGNIFIGVLSYIADLFLERNFLASLPQGDGIKRLVEHAYMYRFILMKGYVPNLG
ncbi:MAG: hypothetical protein MJ093_03010 [Saccharofermentans sp.]|nr:hypothetical protein [Saccharofermentans sp.]